MKPAQANPWHAPGLANGMEYDRDGRPHCRQEERTAMKTLTAVLVLALVLGGYAPGHISPGGMTLSEWTPVFKGVSRHGQGTTDDGPPQKITAIKIDLHDEDIALVTTPSNGPTLGDTDRQTGSQYLASSGVQIAINGQYWTTNSQINWNGELIGLSICEGSDRLWRRRPPRFHRR